MGNNIWLWVVGSIAVLGIGYFVLSSGVLGKLSDNAKWDAYVKQNQADIKAGTYTPGKNNAMIKDLPISATTKANYIRGIY